MSVSRYAAALLDAVKREGFERMPPAERRKLADVLRYVADQAEPKPAPPAAGILADLNNGARTE